METAETHARAVTSTARLEDGNLYEISASDDALLEDMEEAAFLYFREQTHARTGLVRDRARADGSATEGKASIAASGFALSAWVIATERGWAERDAALNHVRGALHFLTTEAPRQRGFFYHFMEMDTGARAWNCELSSVDTSLLIAGAIVARDYFADADLTHLVNTLIDGLDWAWFRNEGTLVSLSWHDEHGFSRYRWNKYSEHVLMSFLALGTSARPVEQQYWHSWDRRPIGRYRDFVYLQEGPLFVHQFPQAYIDLRERRDGFADYFLNSRLATLAQRQFCMDLQAEFPAWRENLWGLTASDSATGYKSWGGPPRPLGFNALDGTIVPCAAAGSLPFCPEETLTVLRHLRGAHGDAIWKRYGFVDAFNPHTGWVNPDVLGIDLGISMVQAENLRTGLVRALFTRSPEAQLALRKAGLISTSRRVSSEDREQLLSLAQSAWEIVRGAPEPAVMRLTSVIAARQLGVLAGDEARMTARGLLQEPTANEPEQLALQAAGWVQARQAMPELAGEATARLASIPWETVPVPGSALGSTARLVAFFQAGAGVRSGAAWQKLSRETVGVGTVRTLAPADARGLLLPGIWVDERNILPGAAASQLAHATITGGRSQLTPMERILCLDTFPTETLKRGLLPTLQDATPEEAAALLAVLANLLTNDSLRRAFQADPLTGGARAAIAEFGTAAFGPHTSIMANHELAHPATVVPVRVAHAVGAKAPAGTWDWHAVAGAEYSASEADIRPGDPEVTFRFAFTWDEAALYLHAEVADSPPGFDPPPERKRVVELYVDPAGDGLAWGSPQDRRFVFGPGEKPMEAFAGAAATADVRVSDRGYSLMARVPWDALGLRPGPGVEFRASPAVVAEGNREWQPVVKLNWCYAIEPGEPSRLGRVVLH